MWHFRSDWRWWFSLGLVAFSVVKESRLVLILKIEEVWFNFFSLNDHTIVFSAGVRDLPVISMFLSRSSAPCPSSSSCGRVIYALRGGALKQAHVSPCQDRSRHLVFSPSSLYLSFLSFFVFSSIFSTLPIPAFPAPNCRRPTIKSRHSPLRSLPVVELSRTTSVSRYLATDWLVILRLSKTVEAFLLHCWCLEGFFVLIIILTSDYQIRGVPVR